MIALVLPASASAADTFVNDATGNDANTCLTAGTACKTIGAGISKAGTNDTVRIAPGSYDEQVTLGGGKSLRGTGPVAQTIVDQSANPNASTIRVANAAGTIEGLTIRGFGAFFRGVLHAEAPVTVRGNMFDEDDPNNGVQPTAVLLAAGAGSATVTENTFDDDGDGQQRAVMTESSGSPQVSDNEISDMWHGIDAQRGTPLIRNNEISEIHSGGGVGTAIQVFSTADVHPTIVENTIRPSIPDGGLPQYGIVVWGDDSDADVAAATLRRNRISGQYFGLETINSDGPVTLDGDALTGNFQGVYAADTTVTTGPGDATLTNVTAWGNLTDIVSQDAHLTLNSTISEDAVATAVGDETATCEISFSRGPAIGTNQNGCDGFQTTAAPQFVDPPEFDDPGDVHLESASPMIDAGDPADSPAGTIDFDGDARELDGDLDCTVHRDIGADEFRPAAPDATIDSGPGDGDLVLDATPTFAFSSDGPAACTSFECRVDGGGFGVCSSPHTTAALAEGAHTLAVRARDANGPGPADSRSFRVDARVPQTTITGGPGGVTSDPTPSFRFASNEPGSSFQCRVDGEPFAACTSPRTTSELADGDHTFHVRARDQALRLDPTPASRSFTVDTTAPETTITKAPKRKVKIKKRKKKVAFEFASNESASFECSLDGEAFQPCTSPVTEKVRKGKHLFEVRGSDRLGNVEETPARHAWKVKRKKRRR
jgi:hypothetical protein